MSKRTISRTFVLVLALGVIYGGLNLAGAAPSGSNTVTVANTATNPVPVNVTNASVPVSGTVTVGNTPSVKLDPTGNTVHLASGTSVGINGTPTVQIDPSAVVKTSAADNPAFQPVFAQLDIPYPGMLSGDYAGVTNLYTVPAGKELVIEQVSFHGVVSAGEDFHTVRLDAGGEPNWLSTLHESTPCDDSNDSCLSGSEVTRIYAGSGKTVGCVFIRYPYTGNAAGQCAFNGYLVNLP